MKIDIIASSSEGNCTYIYSKKARILIDAGISFKQLESHIGNSKIDAIFISHEHADHVRGLGPIARKTGATVYMHELVYKKLENKLNNCNIVSWPPGKIITVKDFEIKNFSTRHDSLYSYGFVIKQNNKKLGYLTDTGSWTKLMGNNLIGCDAYIIETDYDYRSLMEYEEYDELLKERISSNWGHLGNDQTMQLIKYLNIKDPEFIVFAHLSPRTNTQDLVKTAAKKEFPKWNSNIFKIAPTTETLEL